MKALHKRLLVIAIVFIISSSIAIVIVLYMLLSQSQENCPPNMTCTPAATQANYTQMLISVISTLTSAGSAIGFFSTLFLGWKKEKREKQTFELLLAKEKREQEMFIINKEKSRLENKAIDVKPKGAKRKRRQD